MDFLNQYSGLISILCFMLLYVIRTEQKIKNLELEKGILEKINYNESKTLESITGIK